MTLRQLEFLIGVADRGSISACAGFYGVSQPAVTNQIHQLEDELGTSLMVRSAHGTTVTDTGKKVVEQAKHIVQEVNRIPLSLEESKQALTGRVVLGVSPLSPVSVHHFPRIYRPFHKAFPEVHIEVAEIEAMNLANQVANGRIDIGLTPLPMFTTKAQYELLWFEELVVISTGRDLGDSVSMAFLRDEEFVFMKPGYSLNLTTSRLAQQAGFQPRIAAQATSLHALLGFVAAGMGIAIVPHDTVTLEAQAGYINISRLRPRAHRRLAMVFRDQSELTPEVTIFMNYIRSYSRSYSGEFSDYHPKMAEFGRQWRQGQNLLSAKRKPRR